MCKEILKIIINCKKETYKNDVVSFSSNKNANTFCRFFSNLAENHDY